MTTIHAVVWLDHHTAQLLRFNFGPAMAESVHAHTHYTAQHQSGVRDEHAFFRDVCDAFEGIAEVLVTGPKTALIDFRRYVEKHRPTLTKRIAGYEAVDHPSEKELVAFAHKYFRAHDRMNGLPMPL